jgi:hypothetical protein
MAPKYPSIRHIGKGAILQSSRQGIIVGSSSFLASLGNDEPHFFTCLDRPGSELIRTNAVASLNPSEGADVNVVPRGGGGHKKRIDRERIAELKLKWRPKSRDSWLREAVEFSRRSRPFALKAVMPAPRLSSTCQNRARVRIIYRRSCRRLPFHSSTPPYPYPRGDCALAQHLGSKGTEGSVIIARKEPR